MFIRVLGVLCALGLAACASSGGYPENPVNTSTDLDPLKDYFGTKVLKDFNAAPSMAFRNEIIYGRVAAYDAEFSQFQIDIGRERALTDTTGDVAVAALGGVGTALASNATKNALLAATTATTGIKGAIDKDTFYNQAMGSVFSYMASNRKTILAAIVAGTGKSLEDYPLTKGISDTLAYRDAGSIPAALTAIAEQTAPAKADAENKLRDATALNTQMSLLRRGLYFNTTTGQMMRIEKAPAGTSAECKADPAKCKKGAQ